MSDLERLITNLQRLRIILRRVQQDLDDLSRGVQDGRTTVSAGTIESSHSSEADVDSRRMHAEDPVLGLLARPPSVQHPDPDPGSQMFRSVIDYGRDALKAAMLINGGAAIALLAFVGTIWSKKSAEAAAGSLACALASFSFGVLVAAVACAFAYCAQHFYADRTYNWLVDRERSKKAHLRGRVFQWLCLAFVAISFLFFGNGVFVSYEAVTIHLPST